MGPSSAANARSAKSRPGLRTLILVCLGSAAFTMVSYAFGTTTGDTGRVAAQIVTGIGFLGAGVILHGRTAVSGITTAATIWATAATGMVAGVGYVPGAVALSLAIRGILTGAYWWEQQYFGELQECRFEIVADDDNGKTRFKIERLLHDFHVPDCFDKVAAPAAGVLRVQVTFRLPPGHRSELLDQLASLPQVREIRPVGAL